MTGAPSRRNGLGMMLVASALFSVMALCVGEAHRYDPELSTFVATFFRSVVNLVLLVLLSLRNPRRLLGDGRPSLWLRGVFGSLSLATYFAALDQVGVGEAAFLNNTSTFWVAASAPFVLGEPTRPATWGAVTGSLVGMVLLAHPRPEAAPFGRVLGLLSGVTAAGAYLTVRRASATNPPIAIVFYFTVVGTLLSTVIVLALHLPFPHQPEALLALVGAGTAATFAQLAMTEAYRIGPAAPVAATGAAGPFLSAVLGWLFLGQVPDSTGLIGMAVLFAAGVALPFLSG